MRIKVFILILCFCFADELINLPVTRIILEVNGKTSSRAVTIARDLIEKGFDVHINFLLDDPDSLEAVLERLTSTALDQSTVQRLVLASLLLNENQSFDEQTNQKLRELRDNTINHILESDKNLQKVLRIFNNLSFSPFPKNPSKIYPIWIIETDKGNVILEGYKGNLKDFLDIKERKLNIEGLKRSFGDGAQSKG